MASTIGVNSRRPPEVLFLKEADFDLEPMSEPDHDPLSFDYKSPVEQPRENFIIPDIRYDGSQEDEDCVVKQEIKEETIEEPDIIELPVPGLQQQRPAPSDLLTPVQTIPPVQEIAALTSFEPQVREINAVQTTGGPISVLKPLPTCLLMKDPLAPDQRQLTDRRKKASSGPIIEIVGGKKCPQIAVTSNPGAPNEKKFKIPLKDLTERKSIVLQHGNRSMLLTVNKNPENTEEMDMSPMPISMMHVMTPKGVRLLPVNQKEAIASSRAKPSKVTKFLLPQSENKITEENPEGMDMSPMPVSMVHVMTPKDVRLLPAGQKEVIARSRAKPSKVKKLLLPQSPKIMEDQGHPVNMCALPVSTGSVSAATTTATVSKASNMRKLNQKAGMRLPPVSTGSPNTATLSKASSIPVEMVGKKPQPPVKSILRAIAPAPPKSVKFNIPVVDTGQHPHKERPVNTPSSITPACSSSGTAASADETDEDCRPIVVSIDGKSRHLKVKRIHPLKDAKAADVSQQVEADLNKQPRQKPQQKPRQKPQQNPSAAERLLAKQVSLKNIVEEDVSPPVIHNRVPGRRPQCSSPKSRAVVNGTSKFWNPQRTLAECQEDAIRLKAPHTPPGWLRKKMRMARIASKAVQPVPATTKTPEDQLVRGEERQATTPKTSSPSLYGLRSSSLKRRRKRWLKRWGYGEVAYCEEEPDAEVMHDKEIPRKEQKEAGIDGSRVAAGAVKSGKETDDRDSVLLQEQARKGVRCSGKNDAASPLQTRKSAREAEKTEVVSSVRTEKDLEADDSRHPSLRRKMEKKDENFSPEKSSVPQLRRSGRGAEKEDGIMLVVLEDCKESEKSLHSVRRSLREVGRRDGSSSAERKKAEEQDTGSVMTRRTTRETEKGGKALTESSEKSASLMGRRMKEREVNVQAEGKKRRVEAESPTPNTRSSLAKKVRMEADGQSTEDDKGAVVQTRKVVKDSGKQSGGNSSEEARKRSNEGEKSARKDGERSSAAKERVDGDGKKTVREVDSVAPVRRTPRETGKKDASVSDSALEEPELSKDRTEKRHTRQDESGAVIRKGDKNMDAPDAKRTRVTEGRDVSPAGTPSANLRNRKQEGLGDAKQEATKENQKWFPKTGRGQEDTRKRATAEDFLGKVPVIKIRKIDVPHDGRVIATSSGRATGNSRKQNTDLELDGRQDSESTLEFDSEEQDVVILNEEPDVERKQQSGAKVDGKGDDATKPESSTTKAQRLVFEPELKPLNPKPLLVGGQNVAVKLPQQEERDVERKQQPGARVSGKPESSAARAQRLVFKPELKPLNPKPVLTGGLDVAVPLPRVVPPGAVTTAHVVAFGEEQSDELYQSALELMKRYPGATVEFVKTPRRQHIGSGGGGGTGEKMKVMVSGRMTSLCSQNDPGSDEDLDIIPVVKLPGTITAAGKPVKSYSIRHKDLQSSDGKSSEQIRTSTPVKPCKDAAESNQAACIYPPLRAIIKHPPPAILKKYPAVHTAQKCILPKPVVHKLGKQAPESSSAETVDPVPSTGAATTDVAPASSVVVPMPMGNKVPIPRMQATGKTRPSGLFPSAYLVPQSTNPMLLTGGTGNMLSIPALSARLQGQTVPAMSHVNIASGFKVPRGMQVTLVPAQMFPQLMGIPGTVTAPSTCLPLPTLMPYATKVTTGEDKVQEPGSEDVDMIQDVSKGCGDEGETVPGGLTLVKKEATAALSQLKVASSVVPVTTTTVISPTAPVSKVVTLPHTFFKTAPEKQVTKEPAPLLRTYKGAAGKVAPAASGSSVGEGTSAVTKEGLVETVKSSAVEQSAGSLPAATAKAATAKDARGEAPGKVLKVVPTMMQKDGIAVPCLKLVHTTVGASPKSGMSASTKDTLAFTSRSACQDSSITSTSVKPCTTPGVADLKMSEKTTTTASTAGLSTKPKLQKGADLVVSTSSGGKIVRLVQPVKVLTMATSPKTAVSSQKGSAVLANAAVSSQKVSAVLANAAVSSPKVLAVLANAAVSSPKVSAVLANAAVSSQKGSAVLANAIVNSQKGSVVLASTAVKDRSEGDEKKMVVGMKKYVTVSRGNTAPLLQADAKEKEGKVASVKRLVKTKTGLVAEITRSQLKDAPDGTIVQIRIPDGTIKMGRVSRRSNEGAAATVANAAATQTEETLTVAAEVQTVDLTAGDLLEESGESSSPEQREAEKTGEGSTMTGTSRNRADEGEKRIYEKIVKDLEKTGAEVAKQIQTMMKDHTRTRETRTSPIFVPQHTVQQTLQIMEASPNGTSDLTTEVATADPPKLKPWKEYMNLNDREFMWNLLPVVRGLSDEERRRVRYKFYDAISSSQARAAKPKAALHHSVHPFT